MEVKNGFSKVELSGRAGRYILQSEIARGGMGAVYRAWDCEHERDVAVKEACLKPEVCRDRRLEIRAQLLQEMGVIASLEHVNIPKVYEQFSGDQNEYLVMEYIPGSTLYQIQLQTLADHRLLEEARVLGWAIQTLEVLSFLHERPEPIIHRDIKPENLILAPDGRVMLVDFGLMKQLERQVEPALDFFEATGTIEYAPPEQFADMDWGIDARSDLYSLGAVLYFLLSGQLPPKASQRTIPGSVNLTYKLASIRKVNRTVSARTEQVITKALQFEPAHRYQSARAMREALAPRRAFIQLPF